MSLTSEAEDLIDARLRSISQGSELEKLSNFYERMKKAGIAKTPEYDLPLVDTLGRTALRANKARNSGGDPSRHNGS